MSLFCCNCGDGPLNPELDVACPRCFHDLCGGCTGSDNAHMPAQSFAIHSHGNSTCNNTGHAHSQPSALLSPAISYANPVNTAPVYQAPEPVYCWICCICGGSNSCNVDVGCANCNNHWRDDCCSIYQVPPLKK